jgi:hypothetical protein
MTLCGCGLSYRGGRRWGEKTTRFRTQRIPPDDKQPSIDHDSGSRIPELSMTSYKQPTHTPTPPIPPAEG